MPKLPDFLKIYQSQGKKILAENLVHEIEFSGGTYQVQIQDPITDEEYWVFLHLDDRGNIKDCFCSCAEAEEQSACAHLAAAYLALFRQGGEPLHRRFEVSLWNQLCLLFLDLLGDNPSLLKKTSKNRYERTSIGKEVLFSIQSKTASANVALSEILENRSKETEATSLKFSNLPEKEIALWRAGKPTPRLRYELSYWNDLAHWLMRLQESGQPYKIVFNTPSNKTPDAITISFPEIEMTFHLSQSQLTNIIPALATVNSPLSIKDTPQDTIQSITYDPNSATLKIEPKKAESKKKGVSSQQELEGWIYVPDKGFYATTPQNLLSKQKLSGNDISEVFDHHLPLIKRFLTDSTIHTKTIDISYNLQFDATWNLHITGYVFQLGDLTAKNSHKFGNWIYLDKKGFYPVSEAHFDQVDFEIQQSDIEDFIHRERAWLNTQRGFETHIANVESQIVYSLSWDNRLSFSRIASQLKQNGAKDFGSWVYIEGEGFFSKTALHTNLPLNSDLAIQADHIPLFIRMHQPELHLIHNFFTQHSPIEKSMIRVWLMDDGSIEITPEYILKQEYENKEVRFFEEYAFIPGEGFYELTSNKRLPERFRHAVNIEPDIVPLFIEYELDSLKNLNTHIDPRLVIPDYISLFAKSIVKEATGGYQADLYYETERGKIPLNAIWKAIHKKERFLFSESGCIDLTHKRFDWMKHFPKARFEKKNKTLFLSTLDLIRLHALENIQLAKNIDTESREHLQNLTEFKVPSEPNLKGLKSHLRPYQHIGAHWLWFLYHYQLSGLLCDEMGLGKTHQAMSLLAAIHNAIVEQGENKPHHFLIICPTSVIFHWQEKLAEFLPDLRVCVFHGLERSLGTFQQEYDILLTSYGIWRMEHEVLQKIPFEAAIFDEIQVAKNFRSRINLTLRQVNAKMRLGMTGTPIENHLRELKSLFDLVIPGYMPSDAHYREQFVKPIERENDNVRKALLKRFVKPFMLRRKKSEVITDLPDKIEEISHCELSDDQKKLYSLLLSRTRDQLLQQLQDSDTPIPYMHIFSVLSALKQICDHPAVHLKCPDDYQAFSSGKWDLFLELFTEARESQQKVVIFSQYLHMLDIFQAYLEENHIGFATIRGATRNRGEQVYRFNHDPKCEVFLGSLQAAGLGVDLTAGSVVIHYDRWWNAAREDQATDRVHRIGQTRGVQVFKLVTKNTFEERIDAIITRKSKLMQEIISPDDHRFMKQFTRDELIQLLQDVQEEE